MTKPTEVLSEQNLPRRLGARDLAALRVVGTRGCPATDTARDVLHLQIKGKQSKAKRL